MKRLCNQVMAMVGAGAVWAAVGNEVIAPPFEPTTKDVAAGTEIQDARVLVSGESALRKIGAGAWQLPLAYLAQPWTAAFSVDEGELAFLGGESAGAYAVPTTLPVSITDKALLWVDATDTPHLVAEGGAVATWYDRREPATVTTPAYCRASAYTYSGSSAPKPQLQAMADGQTGVYFGGYGSGTTMEWLLPDDTRYRGTDTRARTYHVFLVYNKLSGVNPTLCGTFTDVPSPFLRGSDNVGYFESASTWPAMANGRTYVNGERIDGTLKSKKGLQLLEMIPYRNVQVETSGFFNAKTAAGAGGDYICEAIVFTNSLTEVERLQVEEYLMAKWLPDLSNRQTPVKVGPQGALVLTDGLSTNRVVRGDGELVDGGSETFVYQQADQTAFNGTLALGTSQSALLLSPVALKVAAGQNVSVANVAAGPTVAVTAAAADTFVKSGDDHLKIHGLPAGVKKLNVTGGSLAIETPYDAQDADVYTEIPLVNGSFEDFAADIAATKPAGDGVWKLTSLTNGWNYRWNNGGSVKVVDFERWTGSGSGMDNATRSAWNIYSHPPEGKCALVLRCGSAGGTGANDAIAVSAPFHLHAGVHEIRYWLCGRQGSSYLGQRLQVRLIAGSSATEKAYFGEVMDTDIDNYIWLRMRTTVAEEGDYRIEFRSLDDRDGLIVLDDVHLYAVQEGFATAGRWKIPGGDFETASIPKGNAAQQLFSADYTHPNWTFTQGQSWVSGSLAQVGISTITMIHEGSGHGKGVLYNSSRLPATGTMELCFSAPDTEATTTFTPPAGTWFLQGDAARFGSHGCWPIVTGYITIGDGAETSLGEIAPSSRLMAPMTWPTAFTVDGTQTVTLRLVLTGSVSATNTARNGALLDDLVLTKLHESSLGTELSRCGDCEAAGSDYALKAVAATAVGGESGTVRSRPPSESNAAFGTTVVKGRNFITVENLSIIYEDVALPSAGAYRYAFYVHSRLNDKTGTYRHNPLRFWVERVGSGVTNVIGQVDCYNSAWVQRCFDFTVDAPGTYRLALQGCDNPTAESKHIHEAHVDAISVKQIVRGVRGEEATFAGDLKIRIDEGAQLKVDFHGTNTIASVHLAGLPVSGVIDAEHYPDYIVGAGAFYVKPKGAAIFLR